MSFPVLKNGFGDSFPCSFLVSFEVFLVERADKLWQSEEGKRFYSQMGKQSLPFPSSPQNNSVGEKLLIHSESCQLLWGPGIHQLGSGGWYVV